MNDDDISELILRASAYLDGELSADEVARAEADPAVMAEVEALRALQEQLADVDPPDDDTRERAIAAALDEFDLLHGAGATGAAPAPPPSPSPPSPNVVPFRPRPAYTRWLTAAAAVVAIGVLGAVIAGSQGSDDEEAGGAATATASEAATAEESARMEQAPLDADVPFAAADAQSSTGGEATMDVAEADEPTAAESATATASEPAEGGGDEPVATTQATAVPLTTPEPPVSSTTPPTVPDDLGDIIVDSDNLFEVGQQLLDQYNAGELPNTPETACTFGSYVVLSWARYDVDGTLRPALIAGHPELREVGAFDPDTCLDFQVIVP